MHFQHSCLLGTILAVLGATVVHFQVLGMLGVTFAFLGGHLPPPCFRLVGVFAASQDSLVDVFRFHCQHFRALRFLVWHWVCFGTLFPLPGSTWQVYSDAIIFKFRCAILGSFWSFV